MSYEQQCKPSSYCTALLYMVNGIEALYWLAKSSQQPQQLVMQYVGGVLQLSYGSVKENLNSFTAAWSHCQC